MGWLMLALGLVPSVVQGIQTVYGDKMAGKDKAQMAQDVLGTAVEAAGKVLGQDSVKNAYATISAGIVQAAIDTFVKISKATGHYAKWTAAANGVQTDGAVLGAAVQAVQTINQPVEAPKTGASV